MTVLKRPGLGTIAPALLMAASVLLGGCSSGKKNARLTLAQATPARSVPSPVLPSLPLHPSPSFAELKQLSLNPEPAPPLAKKIHRLFSHPSISNSARPRIPHSSPSLGPFLRVASWNIEKSIHASRAAEALASEDAFKRLLKPDVLNHPGRLAEALRQRQRLVSADVLLLQEMDVGMPRSGYIDATRDIARALGMNYAYGPQQLEIDPATLGLDPGSSAPDPARYRGLFGIAVLSRYPVKSATAFQLKNQPYDWYHHERLQPDPVEKLRRFGAHALLHSKIEREMKIGGRIFFRVDLHVPGLPDNTLTIIHNHLEIKTTTQGREAQLQEILDHIRPVRHAVVMAGDHNSALPDISATSLARLTSRTLKDTQTWLNLLTRTIEVEPAIALTRSALNTTKNLHNPLAFHIPVLLPNHARRLFKLIEDFQFADGGRFDARGDAGRSINGSSGRFANSNEHTLFGLRPTFRVPRPIGPFGRTRLDWIFVKPPSAWQESYRFAPHFGETLEQFDTALRQPLSDHRPIVADLPLQAPPLKSP